MSMAPSSKNARHFGNASRPTSVKPSGDESFDILVRGLWRQHLAETGRPVGWNFNYWRIGMSGVDLGLCADADVLVAEIESDCEECDRDDYA